MKTLIWQNVTEGPMTEELRNADIVFLSEVSVPRLRQGRPWPRFRTIKSRKTPGLAISVNRREFKIVKTGALRFHRSGKAEGWDGIATPARGLLFVRGYWKDDPQKRQYTYWVTWFLNSWKPMKSDRWTEKREAIVRTLSIPVVENFVQAQLHHKKVQGIIGGGDTNSLRWSGDLRKMTPVYNKGLDRVWKAGHAVCDFVDHTAETGVGSQMRHKGIKIRQKIRKLKEG